MIDLHSHILPCVDDGSDSLEVSLKLLANEISCGVTDVVLTPHYKTGVYDLSKAEIKRSFDEFASVVKANGLNVNLYLGQEIFCGRNVYDVLKNGEVLTMNDTKFVLVEFDYFNETDIQDYVYNIKLLGYTPIIAHVERYSYLDWNTIFDLRSLGAYIQVNASSVTGEYGKKFQKSVLTAIKNGLIDFVASDVHSGRECLMQKAYKIVQQKVCKQAAVDLFYENAICCGLIKK